jgi:hypothetical protein
LRLILFVLRTTNKYHEVHRHEIIPDSHRNIFRDSHWTPDRLIRQL